MEYTNQARDIHDLLQEGKIEVETKGDGMTSVQLTVRRRTHNVITVEIPPGTIFVSRNRAVYRMVVTTASTRTLDSDTWAFISVSVVFANRPDEIPGEKDSFNIVRSPQQPELTNVMLVLEEAGASHKARQAAVWIVTDNVTYSQLDHLVRRPLSIAFGGDRVIEEKEAAEAMRFCEEAGIDITRKRIWQDRKKILSGLGDGELKQWIQGRE